MSDYIDYGDRPTLDDAPDECQYEDCSLAPRYYVKFRSPSEYVCYCNDHADEMYMFPNAKIRSLLR